MNIKCMYNLGDDKELDRLSREAAGRYEPPGNPDWEAMAAALDTIMPVEEKKRRGILFWWWVPILLLGSGITYFALHSPETPITKATEKAPVAAQDTHQTPDNNEAAAIPDVPQKPNPAVSIPKAEKPVQEVTVSQNSNRNPGPVKNKTTAISVQKLSRQADDRIKPNLAQTNPVADEKSITVQRNDNTSLTKEDNSADDKSRTVQTTEQPAQKITDAVPVKNSAVEQPAPAPSQPAANTSVSTDDAPLVSVFEADREAQKRGARGRGWSYTLLAGVDKSTVKFVYGNDPGYNLGITGGYHFNDRWSLHTGAIYTQKQYKLAGKDFTAPKGTPISYYKLETVEGTCRMWEIPVLLRYSTRPAEKNSLFFSAGLSSYFMTKELYDYFYYFNNNPVTRSNTYNSDDKHILSIVHLSAGFESRISKHWSVQIEPYGKLPLGGVGFGSIRLSSFGLNFAVQRRQPSR
jgi:hypothetical protein